MSKYLSTRGQESLYALQESFAETFSVQDVRKTFAVSPTIAQELNDRITERADFLSMINVFPVTEIKGQKVFLGLSGPATSRTDTRTKDREPVDLLDLEDSTYELFHTETDVTLPFAKIDAWAKFEDFYDRYAAAVQKQIALDRMLIAWSGTHVAENTDIQSFPMLQDVNKGWLQIAREQIPAQVLNHESGDKITLGTGGDYPNLDALVHDIKQMIPPAIREGGDLVAIVGSDLLERAKAKLYSSIQSPSEKPHIERIEVSETFGGLPAISPPFFPPMGVVVTSLDNLSIYFQETSWRRHILDNPKRSRVEDYNGRNEGYVIEQLRKFAAIESDSLELLD